MATTTPTVLTTRELEVLHLAALGLTNAAIARELWLSSDTVKIHMTQMMRKLDADNRAHAVTQAFRHGVLRVAMGEDGDQLAVGAPIFARRPL